MKSIYWGLARETSGFGGRKAGNPAIKYDEAGKGAGILKTEQCKEFEADEGCQPLAADAGSWAVAWPGSS